MRKLWLVLVGAAVVVGGVGCGPKRVRVANTPEGQACSRQCMSMFNDCYQGKRKNKKVCTERENECLRTCPGAGSNAEAPDTVEQ